MTLGMWDTYEWHLLHHRGAVLRGTSIYAWGRLNMTWTIGHVWGITTLGYVGHL